MFREKVLFNDQAKSFHTGVDFGVVHPKHPDFPHRMAELKRLTGADRIVAQKLGFNTRVTDFVSHPAQIEQGTFEGENIDGFFRTVEVTDGLIIPPTIDQTRGRVAGLIMNADCGVGKILSPDGRLAVLHLALECVDHKDGSSLMTNSIQYLQNLGIGPRELQVEIGEAALECCFGYDPQHPKFGEQNRLRAEKLGNAWGSDVIQEVAFPPRKGQLGINVPLIAQRQAEALGVQNIVTDRFCTSHAGLPDEDMSIPGRYGDFFSNIRDPKMEGLPYNMRNAAVVLGNK